MENIFKNKMKYLTVVIFVLLGSQVFAQSLGKNHISLKGDSATITATKNSQGPGHGYVVDVEGFSQFEEISVFVKQVNEAQYENVLLARWTVYADISGKIAFGWKAPFEGRFELSATGSKSGKEAQTTVSSLVPTPIVVSGNPSCADLNADNANFPHIMSDWGFKLDNGRPNGTYAYVNSGGLPTTMSGGAPADPGNSVTISVPSNGMQITSWSSTRPISAVIIKRGGGAVVYPYNPASNGPDGPLPTGAQQSVSHVEFCFQASAKIIIRKHANPPSTYPFGFTASPDLTPSSFSLVDNDPNSDPMRMFTVNNFGVKTITETNPGPYTLRSIVCSVDIGTGGTPTPTRNGDGINIDIKPGDQVTCTFTNDVLTASTVSASGRVFDSAGNGLPGAIVTVSDSSGNLQVARTNQFGYYTVNELEAGGTYVFEVRHKQYSFPLNFINVNESLNNLNFHPQ